MEIDGISHDMGDGPKRDAGPNAWLKEHGLAVLRIAASEVMHNTDETADGIARIATEMIWSGAPSTTLTRGPPLPLRR